MVHDMVREDKQVVCAIGRDVEQKETISSGEP